MKTRIIITVMLFFGAGSGTFARDTLSAGMQNHAEIIADWESQDRITSKGYRRAVGAIIALPEFPSSEKSLLKNLLDSYARKADGSAEMKSLYYRACSIRRAVRIGPYLEKFGKTIFSQHPVLADKTYFVHRVNDHDGYEGKGLELLAMNGNFASVTHLLPSGEARDPCVSFDGKKVLFSWRGGGSGSETYHVYEMTLADRAIRQITHDGASGPCDDFDAVYLPNGNILFHSTRHIQLVDCIAKDPPINTPVWNLYLCDEDGSHVRRVGFDQAPTDDPVVMPSGEVVYARWDYNDKAHTYSHALFIMNPDGTAQREYCNNNSWWPTMILQPRPIPGTNKVMAMIGGYHRARAGKIGIIDVSKGIQNGAGVTLLAPVRLPKDDNLDAWGGTPTKGVSPRYPFPLDLSMFPRPGAGPLDGWGQKPPMFCYPYPFDEHAFLVSFSPKAMDHSKPWLNRFGLYFMLADGQRELLFYDPAGSCMAAVPALPREKPPVPASVVDYRDSTGVFQIMNIYTSQPPVLDGIERGTIKRLRVVALDYRPGPSIGHGNHYGPGCLNVWYIGASFNNPVATNNACYDVKVIVGETPVYEDGSASFIAPARTPLFFQALDEKGNMVQTMRSWATLQPGETFACVGCHESKLSAPPPLSYIPRAMKVGPKPLEPFYGPMRGFSYDREIQPILDRKCATCHDGAAGKRLDLRGNRYTNSRPENFKDNPKNWPESYCNLTGHHKYQSKNEYVNWLSAEDSPLLLPPYRGGACESPLIDTLEGGHQNVKLTKEELDKIKCWIDLGVPCFGDYASGLVKTGDRQAVAEKLRLRGLWENEEERNIAAYVKAHPATPAAGRSRTFPPGNDRSVIRAVSRRGILEIALESASPILQGRMKLQIFDLRGVLVRVLEHEARGERSILLDTRALSPGRYFLRLETAGFEQTIPLMLL